MSELLNKDGLTEAEFLARYDASKFERPSVTVDIIIIRDGEVLLIRRGNHPSLGKLAFPGGFVEPNDTVPAAAVRELYEETGLSAHNYRQLGCFSKPDRDPRTRIITVPFLADVEKGALPKADDDAADASFFPFSVKKMPIGKDTLYEITVNDNGKRLSTKVKKSFDKDGVFAFPSYEVIGESFFAGDHAAIFCEALDEPEKNK